MQRCRLQLVCSDCMRSVGRGMIARAIVSLRWLKLVFLAPIVAANVAHADCSLGHNLACVGPESICWPAVIGSRDAFGQCLAKFDNGYCLPCAGFNDPRACATDGSDCRPGQSPTGGGGTVPVGTITFSLTVPLVLAEPTVNANLDGRLEVAVKGPDGTLFHFWETDSGWSPAPANFPGDPKVATPALVVQRGLGALDVFAVAPSGRVGHVKQLAPNVNWGAWEDLGGAMQGTVSGVMRTYADLVLLAIGRDGQFYIATNQGLDQWVAMGPGFSGNATASLNADGRLELFGVRSGTLVHRWELAPGGQWSEWVTLGGPVKSDPVAIQNKDGRIAVFVSTPAGKLQLYEQQAVNSGWKAPFSFVGTHQGHPSVVRDAKGALNVFVVGTNVRAIYYAHQNKAAGNFGKFSSIGGSVTSSPAVALNKAGELKVFGVGDDGALWMTGQASGKWSNWQRLGGEVDMGQL